MGAVGYRGIGGKLIEALARQHAVMDGQPDPLVPAQEIGAERYPASLLAAIDKALSLKAEDRPQNVAEMLALTEQIEDEAPTVILPRIPVSEPAALFTSQRGLSIVGSVGVGIVILLATLRGPLGTALGDALGLWGR